MNLQSDCLDVLKYPTFWKDTVKPSLRDFLSFRYLEGDLTDPTTEHLRYKAELDTISDYYDETSEVGKMIQNCIQGFSKEKCSRSIKFFWELRDICNESELVDEKSKLQWKEGIFEFEKTGLCHLRETSSAVQEKQISSYTSYEKSEAQTNNVYDRAEICTPKRAITLKNKENENLCYDTSPKYICKKPLPNPFLVNKQGKKRGFEAEEDDDDGDEEFDANLTVVGGKSAEWIVNSIRIRERLKEYQLEKNPPKTSPEYYDVIFFNSNKDGFLKTLDESILTQMLSDISEKEIENTVENEIKLLLDHVIDRDIKKTKEKLKQVKEEDIALFENKFALNFVRHMMRLMEDINLLLDPMSEGTYINSVLAPIFDEFFVKNKRQWRASYGETCLKASARDKNSQKEDSERRSTGKKIDTIIELREENEEFSVIEISGPPMKNNWPHYKGDRLKIAKMLKTIINHYAELNPTSDITLVKLYGLQAYLNEITIYEFRLKFAEIYTMRPILKFSLPKTWADMARATKSIMGFLKYESLLVESAKSIQDFLWNEGGEIESFKKMTT
ncbi:8111_t:CDS:2, partial [Diversispora eburnea]